jgi:hypothetical protein
VLSVALILLLHAGDCRTVDHWKEAGLESSCRLLQEIPSAEQVNVLSKQWSLTKEQAECARDAVNATPVWDRGYGERWSDPEPWRRCISRWPDVKAFWVGLFAARGHADQFAPQLSEELADDLYRLSFSSHPSLALRLFKAKPERLQEFLKGPEGWYVAGTIWAEHPSGVRPEDWEPLARRFLGSALFVGDLILVADFWKDLPQPTRKALREAPLLHDKQELRAHLALALVLAGEKEEAGLVPLEGDPLLADVVRWNLTGMRTFTPWKAGIEFRMHRFWHFRNDVRAALYPFTAPHFGLSDACEVVGVDFSSGATGDSAFSRRLRSARARAFLMLKAEVEKKPSVAATDRATEKVSEFFSAYLAANGCPPDTIRRAWGDVILRPREPNSWNVELPRNLAWAETCVRPLSWYFRRPTTITLSGDDQAFIEVRLGAVRADRDPGGKLQLKILWAGIE